MPEGRKGHPTTCACVVCRKTRAARAAGKEPRAITRKERFASNVVEQLRTKQPLNATKAAIAAGYPEANADIIGSQNLRDPHTQVLIEKALRKARITADSWMQVGSEGLRATDIRLAQFEGKFTDEREVPDWSARHRFFESVGKAAGFIRQEQTGERSALILRIGNEEIIKGHGVVCSCDACIAEWEKRAEKMQPAPIPDEWKK